LLRHRRRGGDDRRQVNAQPRPSRGAAQVGLRHWLGALLASRSALGNAVVVPRARLQVVQLRSAVRPRRAARPLDGGDRSSAVTVVGGAGSPAPLARPSLCGFALAAAVLLGAIGLAGVLSQTNAFASGGGGGGQNGPTAPNGGNGGGGGPAGGYGY
jgi:hypothetical protein